MRDLYDRMWDVILNAAVVVAFLVGAMLLFAAVAWVTGKVLP